MIRPTVPDAVVLEAAKFFYALLIVVSKLVSNLVPCLVLAILFMLARLLVRASKEGVDDTDAA